MLEKIRNRNGHYYYVLGQVDDKVLLMSCEAREFVVCNNIHTFKNGDIEWDNGTCFDCIKDASNYMGRNK